MRTLRVRTNSGRELHSQLITRPLRAALANAVGRWGAKASFIGANCIDCNSRPAGRLSDDEIVAVTLRELRENIPGAREASPLPAINDAFLNVFVNRFDPALLDQS